MEHKDENDAIDYVRVHAFWIAQMSHKVVV